MTEFTRIIIDPRHRNAARVLSSPERLHAVVARSFDPAQAGSTDTQRVLWRMDEAHGRASRLYAVADRAPDITVLGEQLGVDAAQVSTCSYEPFLDSLERGQEWGFRLKANPTKSHPSGGNSQRGKRFPLTKIEDQLDWMLRKAGESGFHMPINRLEVPEVMVRETKRVSFNRRGGQVRLTLAVYEGVLAIDDPDLLRRAMTSGIGRAKGYGCGLLTLVPLTRGQQLR